MGSRGEPPAGVPSAVTALAGPSWKVSLWTDPVPGCVHESCKHARGGVCGGSRATHLPFPHRKPTSLRSMLFILAPTAASWPPEGLTASSSSGMSWEVGPCAQASPVPSVQPHPRRAPWWVRAWGLASSHLEHAGGSGQMTPGKNSGPTASGKGRAPLLGLRPAGRGGLSSDGPFGVVGALQGWALEQVPGVCQARPPNVTELSGLSLKASVSYLPCVLQRGMY